jgi:hypothetical protein
MTSEVWKPIDYAGPSALSLRVMDTFLHVTPGRWHCPRLPRFTHSFVSPHTPALRQFYQAGSRVV